MEVAVLGVKPLRPPGGVLVTAVAGSEYHTLALTAAGALLALGSNEYGQLGLAASVPHVATLQPVALPGDARAARVACGVGFSIVATTAGALFACGLNDHGQLGLGADLAGFEGDDEEEPKKVHGLRRVALPDNALAAQVACGFSHTCILTRTGTLLGCGYNEFGQLGLGESEDDVPSAQPVPLPAGAIAAQVQTVYRHRASRRLHLGREDLDQRRFASAIGSKQSGCTGFDVEINAV